MLTETELEALGLTQEQVEGVRALLRQRNTEKMRRYRNRKRAVAPTPVADTGAVEATVASTLNGVEHVFVGATKTRVETTKSVGYTDVAATQNGEIVSEIEDFEPVFDTEETQFDPPLLSHTLLTPNLAKQGSSYIPSKEKKEKDPLKGVQKEKKERSRSCSDDHWSGYRQIILAQQAELANTPPPDPEEIMFDGSILKLTRAEFMKLRERFPNLVETGGIKPHLEQADHWLADRPNHGNHRNKQAFVERWLTSQDEAAKAEVRARRPPGF